MLKVLSCVAIDHDWRLVLVAAVVCLVSAVTAFRFYALAAATSGRVRLAWTVFGGGVAGSGIWATHFIAMLAYQPGFTTGYALGGTLLSWVLAAATTGLGLGVAAGATKWPRLAAGGAVLGLGISVMHYAGMAAYRIQGLLLWDGAYVAASVTVGVLLAAAAMAAAGRAARARDQMLGAGLLTLAICGMHFTGMGAATLAPDRAMTVANQLLDRQVMVVAVSALAVMLALAAVGAVALEAAMRRSSLVRMQCAIDAIQQPLAIFDNEDRYAIWNRPYAELARAEGLAELTAGVTFRDGLERALAAGSFPAARGREAAWLEERLAWRRAAPSVIEQEMVDGRWLRIEERRMPDGGVVSICVDLTDMKRDAEVLARARDEAEAANRAKTEFLTNMSHEIRTPLNGVLGAADILARGELTPEQRAAAQLVQTSARTLERLLSDVLDLARIEAGRLSLSPEPFRPSTVIRDVVALHRAAADEKGVALHVVLAAEADGLMVGDPLRLGQVLGNLVSNAVKFTEAGEIRISAAPDAAGSGRWRFAVTDTGVGFSEEDRARIFERFEQADGALTRRFGGAGLGLAISRQIAELMDGRLDAESRPGAGSTFALTLPLRPAAAGEAAPEEAPADEPDELPPLRILLADDHPGNRQVISLMLSQASVELVSVENGREAVDAFAPGRFDTILMDLQMPVMDGVTAIRAIRDVERQAGGAPTPILVVSANVLPEHVAAAMAAGADRCLAKPIGVARLFDALAEAENLRERRAA